MANLKLNQSSGSGTITLKGAASGSNDVELTLPNDIGSNGEFLKLSNVSDKTGTLSFGDAADSSNDLRIGGSTAASYSGFSDIFLGGTGHLYAETSGAAGNSFSISQNAAPAADGDWDYLVTDEASNINQNGGDIKFRTAPSGTAGNNITWSEKFKIANGGDVTVSTGNLVIGTDGKGVDFSASSHATGMSNELLDDYEEGVHTFAIQGSTTNPSSVTYNSSYDVMNYIKIGNVCHLWGELRWSFSAGNYGEGQARWTIPFASANTGDGNCVAAGTVQFWNVDWKQGQTNADAIFVEINDDKSYMIVRRSQSDSSDEHDLELGTDTFSSSIEMTFSITYKTA